MKLIFALLILFPFLSYADEGSANSARSSENSPVIPAGQGEGELSVDNGGFAKASQSNPAKMRKAEDADVVCKANADPATCTNEHRKMKKKKKKKAPED